jgi:hypothetical protein
MFLSYAKFRGKKYLKIKGGLLNILKGISRGEKG